MGTMEILETIAKLRNEDVAPKQQINYGMNNRYQNRIKIPTIHQVDNFEFSFFQQLSQSYNVGHVETSARALYDAAQKGPGDGFIVELGTQYGDGTILLAAGSKSVNREKVITIDNDIGGQGCLYSKEFWCNQPVQQMRFYMNLMMLGVNDWVIPLCCTAEFASIYLNINARVIFFDASHEYEFISNDIKKWSPKLIPGGIMLFHDTDYPPVMQAIQELIIESPDFSDIEKIDNTMVMAVKL